MSSQLLKGKKILVVDDEDLIREIIVGRFKRWGAQEVTETNGGHKAYELLKQKNFDLVFTDIRMPEGDGITLIKQVNENLKQIPIFFVATGFSDATQEEIESLGVKYIFNKPFPHEMVEKALQELFGS